MDGGPTNNHSIRSLLSFGASHGIPGQMMGSWFPAHVSRAGPTSMCSWVGSSPPHYKQLKCVCKGADVARNGVRKRTTTTLWLPIEYLGRVAAFANPKDIWHDVLPELLVPYGRSRPLPTLFAVEKPAKANRRSTFLKQLDHIGQAPAQSAPPQSALHNLPPCELYT